MCGLTGYLTNANNGFNNDNINVMLMSMFLNQIRGRDSTGVVGVSGDGDWYWEKEVGGLSDLLQEKKYKDWQQELFRSGKLYFSHGRAATRGTINQKNAHPFEEQKPGKDKGSIVLIHNGTLDVYQTLKGMKDFEVDSNWIASVIANEGPEKIPEINGAMALIWYDSEDKSLNFYRNHQRPLFCARGKNGEFIFNSEKEALIYLRHKFRLTYTDEDLREFAAMHHYKLRLEKPDVLEKKELKRPFVHYTGSHRRHPYGEHFLGEDVDDDVLDYHQRKWKDRVVTPPITNDPRDWDKYALGIDCANDVHRNYEKDIEYLLGRKFQWVEWRTEVTGGISSLRRWTKLWNGGYTTHPAVAPYLPGLIRMESNDKDGTVIITRKDGEQIHTTNVRPRLRQEKKIEEPCIQLDYKANKRIKWNQKVAGGQVIKHFGLCSESKPEEFISYSNRKDGSFLVGDDVAIEVNEVVVVDKENKVIKCIGSRLQERTDSAIDFAFFTNQFTEDEVRNHPLFAGKIASIKVASKEHNELTKAVVVAGLAYVEPIFKDKGETAVVEIPVATLPASIH